MRFPRLNHSTLISLLAYHVILLWITVSNFPVGKYFLGWDALNPEFNFPLNFMRAFSGLWQENYATGVVGGHGFASTLPHTLITYLLSFILPQSAIRPAFTFLCLYLGGLGMFFLVRNLLTLLSKQERFAKILPYLNYIALLSSLFYVLNLGTLQIFYVQLETFIVHFAVLPWLFLSALKLLKKISAKTILFYSLISFLGSTQGFIPSLFVAYGVGLTFFLALYLFSQRTLSVAVKSLVLLLLTFVTNAYWLLPLAYFQLTESSIFLNSYNNLSSTLYFIDVNKKFGTFLNVALLKGFFFESYQLGNFILQPWINHLHDVLPILLGYGFFAIIITGVISSAVRIKDWTIKALIAVFLFFFISIATDLYPLNYLTHLLELLSPTYEQAFRNAFTKFSIGTAFMYSIFLGLGLAYVTEFLIRKGSRLAVTSIVVIFIALLYYAAPTLTGNLLYSRTLITLPSAYQDVMTYFTTQPDGRIADLPQECAEGWYSYNWGYFGSGFYWYGIKQPFLSRTFDVWSKPNENYYWEITNAIKNQNNAQIDTIFRKYNASWILYDPNELYCRNQKGVFLQDDLIKHIQSSPNYTLVKKFESPNLAPISLYRYSPGQTTSFVSLKSNVPNVGPEYNWNNLDLAASSDYQTTTKTAYDTFYPFRSLFTNRRLEEREFNIDKKASSITFTTRLPQNLHTYTFTTPPYNTLEPSVPLLLTLKKNDDGTHLIAKLLFPYLSLDGKPLSKYQPEFDLGVIPVTPTQNISFIINSAHAIKQSATQFISTWYFAVPLTIDVKTDSQTVKQLDLSASPLLTEAFSYQPKTTLPEYTDGVLTVEIPIVLDDQTQGIERFTNLASLSPEICRERANNQVRYEVSSDTIPEYIRLHTTDTRQCLTLHFPKTLTTYGYLGEIDARTIAGNKPTFSIFSANRLVYNEESLATSDTIRPFYFILPPTLKNEVGYSVQFANDSENSHESTVDFAGIGLYSIPYNFMKQSSFTRPTKKPRSVLTTISVDHPSSTFYRVQLPQSSEQQTLILSQTFASGWHAYMMNNQQSAVSNHLLQLFPFFYGTELTNHILVDNWKNGWDIPANVDTQTVVIFFLPQLLEYLGLLLLFIPCILAALWRLLPFSREI